LQRKNINPLNRSVDYKEINKLINDAMLKLDKADYDILYELYFNHTSVHQLSKKLGISRPAVRYRRDKALKRLKEIIKKEMRDWQIY
jgi:RNA polymerase sigma factor (sigma-70 family)